MTSVSHSLSVSHVFFYDITVYFTEDESGGEFVLDSAIIVPWIRVCNSNTIMVPET